MPMNSSQLAALVERAKQKAPPVVSPPRPPAARPQRPTRPAPAPAGPPAPSTKRSAATAPAKSTPAAAESPAPRLREAPTPPLPLPAQLAETEDFPIDWALTKESWHFHRRFYRVFRRPMAHGEYSHLLWQIRHRKAEHLGDNAWRVTLPDGRRTLAVCATRWQLLTILPKGWQPAATMPEPGVEAERIAAPEHVT